MTEKDKLIQDLKRELEEYKQRQIDTLQYIEDTCVYDSHLLGYVRGIERGQTNALVLKLTGKHSREIKRSDN